MDAIKAKDITRHIFKDEDKGIEMMEGLNLSDSIEVMTKIIPGLVNAAKEKGNVNDEGYFNSLYKIYNKVLVEKLKKQDHLWMVYCDTTAYPYMVDDDLIVLYNYHNHEKVEQQLKKAGYKVSLGIESPETFFNEIGHMYRNGYKNIRFTDGITNDYKISREEFATYDAFFKNEDYVTNPGLQNSMISFFQEFRKEGKTETKEEILKSHEVLMFKAMKNAEYMVPCIKEETETEVSISHPFIDLTDKVSHAESEQIISVPVFTDGFEMDKCYKDQHENMLYKFEELIDLMNELEASGIIINALGISYFLSVENMKKINSEY